MKIIHATWEKRNLGVDCYEIIIGERDSLEIVIDALSDVDTDYMVVKIPGGRTDVMLYLQQAGYTFIEMMTLCHCGTTLPTLSPLQQRIQKEFVCTQMDANDLQEIYSAIHNNLFADDRISKDPYFNRSQSNNRYIGWLGDQINQGALVYKLNYHGHLAAFFALKHINQQETSFFLGGVLPRYQTMGAGPIMLFTGINTAIQSGAARVHMAYSSNNRGSSAMHLSLGLVLDMQYAVFIKHRDFVKGG